MTAILTVDIEIYNKANCFTLMIQHCVCSPNKIGISPVSALNLLSTEMLSLNRVSIN